MSSLRYVPWHQWQAQTLGSRAARFLAWAMQGLCWAVFCLESPAWQATARYLGSLFADVSLDRHWRLGDPVRIAIRVFCVALVRTTPKPRHPRMRPWIRPLDLSRGMSILSGRLASHLQAAIYRLHGSRQAVAAWQQLQGLTPRQRRWLAIPGWIVVAMFAALCITQPFNYFAQFIFVVMLWVVALVIRQLTGRLATLTLIVLSVTVSCRYLWWRYTATLNWNNPFDLVCGLVLLAAETYSWLVLMLGYVQVAWPLQRKPKPLPGDYRTWPSVDVVIPTYNEDLSVVRHSVYAALALDWPREKLRIHLLDDGRRPAFAEFADQVGIQYVTRDNNRHAKAGNLNQALAGMDGELVAVFDCDHMPVRSFLQVTVGWFVFDPRLALVQTPHHFFSPDPFERNLRVFRRDPNEGELFYGLIQDGNDLWNAAFFCGSCAVLRRSAIDEIGGFATETVTEDAHTALRLHRRGWNSAYLRLPQAAGLATDSLGAHVNQRIRWARGMVQIFRLDNPLLGKGLSIFQRFCYANAMLHFMAGLPRLVFLLAPLAFLYFHAYIIYAPALAIVLFVLPHMAHASLTNARIQGRHRRPFWGEVYETVLAWYIARPTLVALVSPRRGTFNVTEKGGVQQGDSFDWRIARPYLVLALLNVVGVFFAVWRWMDGPADERATVVVSLLWVIYNLLIIGGALAVAAEVHQVRRTHRVATRMPAGLQLANGRRLRGELLDYSNDGVGMRFSPGHGVVQGDTVTILLGRGERGFAFPGVVQRISPTHLGVLLAFSSEQQRVDFAQCTFARADAWLGWHADAAPQGLSRSLWGVLRMGWRGYLRIADFSPPLIRRQMAVGHQFMGWLASFRPSVFHQTPAVAAGNEHSRR